MIDTKTFLKIPLKFEDKCKVYPPSIEEVYDEENFNLYRTFLCICDEDIEDQYKNQNLSFDNLPTPLEFILGVCYKDKQMEKIVQDGFKFFIHEPVTFLYEAKSIMIGDLVNEVKNIKGIKDLKLITEKNFLDFQNLIRASLGEKPVEGIDLNEHPKIREMKAKARYRDRIKQKRGVSGGISFQTSLEALCCMGIGLTPLNIGQLSYAAVSVLMNRYQLKHKYETDISSLMAGAKASKVHPVYWIKDEK